MRERERLFHTLCSGTLQQVVKRCDRYNPFRLHVNFESADGDVVLLHRVPHLWYLLAHLDEGLLVVELVVLRLDLLLAKRAFEQ